NPASYRVVRTKSYLFNKAVFDASIPPCYQKVFTPQGRHVRFPLKADLQPGQIARVVPETSKYRCCVLHEAHTQTKKSPCAKAGASHVRAFFIS
ncbi:hypothetical protein, partial [Klebsiella pneumoniae]|uniref:hypothetical protein n=1 Tax=Klebsiella pneumoniae TaxID=573 RepID=UPI0019D5491C